VQPNVTGEEIIALATPIWAEELRRRQQEHARVIREIDADCAARGIGRSGAHISLSSDACINEVRTRAHLATRVVRKVVQQTQARFSANELRSIYSRVITNMYQDIDASLQRTISGFGPIGASVDSIIRTLSDEEVAAIDKEIAELNVVAATPLDNSRVQGVVVHGDAYSIQTGDGARAEVTVNVESSGLEKLRDAIKLMRESLAKESPTDLPSYADALLSDLELEASEPVARPDRLYGLLIASATIIQTMGAVPSAWGAVRSAAQAIGVNLP
jgi:hypothetical protein